MNQPCDSDVRISRSWRAVREQFILDPDLVHLAPMILASHPQPVRESIDHFRLTLDRNPKRAQVDLEQNDARVLGSAGAYFGCSPNEIALTDSTTMGLGLLMTALDLKAEDQILHGDHDHYSSDTAIGYAVQRHQCTQVEQTLYDPQSPQNTTEDEILQNVLAGVTDATRLLMLTWVDSTTGVKLPLRRITAAIRALNEQRTPDRMILVAVDGVHALGVEDFTLSDELCDFFIAGCHKTLCGPRGTGIMWASPVSWQRVRRTIPPFGKDLIESWRLGTAVSQTAIGRLMTPGGYHSFELRWALADAFMFQLQLGKRRVQQRLHRLASFCKERLCRIPNVDVLTPRSTQLSAAMICFNVGERDPIELEEKLFCHGIVASVSPGKRPCLRFAVGLYTSHRDILAGLKAIDALR
jgi:isopenicillin-N epimerase